MTTMNAARELIYSTFITDWAGATPITFANESFNADTEGGDAWVRLTIHHKPSRQRSLGPVGQRKYDRLASVIVQVYTDVDEGVQTSDTHVTSVKDIFEGSGAMAGLDFFVAEFREIGPDGRWFQVNVEIPFTYEEIR